MTLEQLKAKSILILGFGREGQDAFLFLRKLFPDKMIGVADIKKEARSIKYKARKDSKIKWHLGKDYLKALKNYDVIIKSPGIPFKILPRTVLVKVITQTDIFFDNCPGKIVGITGTKGKSTTSALIYQILKAGLKASSFAKGYGGHVHLVGNIGKPVLNLLPSSAPKDVYVYELSSHQLYSLKKSPHIAILLNIYQEHLDYYKNFKEYAAAKANITLHQKRGDYLIFNSGNKIVREMAQKSKARKIPIGGKYYALDINAAREVGKVFHIQEKIIAKAIKEFKPLSHRLEFVGEFKEIKFYNDSLSTIPETAIHALNFLGRNVQTLILGGFDRGLNFKNLTEEILKSKIKTLIFFPATGEIIFKELQSAAKVLSQKQPSSHFFVKNMKEAVKLAYLHTQKGKICLLSPASPSFGLFLDYKDRGNQFKKYVREYGIMEQDIA